MFVEVVARLKEMLIKSDAVRSLHIIPVGIDPEVRRRLALSNVLFLLAEDAMSQVDDILALAIQVMAYLQSFPCHVAGECFCRLDVPTALVSGRVEAGFRAWVLWSSGVLGNLLVPGQMDLPKDVP